MDWLCMGIESLPLPKVTEITDEFLYHLWKRVNVLGWNAKLIYEMNLIYWVFH